MNIAKKVLFIQLLRTSSRKQFVILSKTEPRLPQIRLAFGVQDLAAKQKSFVDSRADFSEKQTTRFK